ncbi:chaperone activator Aha1 [Schizosaccharomyces japonicus yFS275]|uniref:Chaperone activator Aha1 n=1 Tax=Schizosaccharomyces japonicus (strain yFS275 / FY16936) TaxID=402676 RepID=B6JZT2_SCHJY|nr:chaperone activator Aha1 [Schizosaccharomyces japonicus yFS275]EEB06082.1 chaperone activator Aha1 [Schizosaccharomyces japonicus yFS275]
MSATSVNPNNWHWTSKDCSSWSKDYFKTELPKLSVSRGDDHAKVTRLISCEGDVDVAMRKRKVITIFDLKIQMAYSGTVNGTEASGSITCPEVSYDLGENDYAFEIDLYNASKELEPVKEFVRKELLPVIRKLFAGFSKVLIDEHGADVYLPTEEHNGDAARGLPVHSAVKSNAKSALNKPVSSSSSGSNSVVNTATISENYNFDAPADMLYMTFIDPPRVAAWSRAPPQIEARPGGAFSLFNGNVVGHFVEMLPAKKIVQKWRLSSWPTGHYAQLQMVFDQGSDYTVLRIEMRGVPIGEEEIVQNNLLDYYVRPIKTTFGFGAVL